MTTCNPEFNTEYELRTIDNCANKPLFWNDIYGETCDDYESLKFCNPDGSYGIWRPSWGTFADVGNPDKACCACGGGIKFQRTLEYENCVCPAGSTNVDGKCIPDNPNKIIRQTDSFSKEICIDKNPTRDNLFNCNSIAENKVCDPEKPDRKGENWDGTFMQTTLLENCCSCGGGEKNIIEIPIYSVIDCPEGSTAIDGQCVCPGESTLVDGKCVCPGESTLVDGKCVCPGGKILDTELRCVCPEGKISKNNICVERGWGLPSGCEINENEKGMNINKMLWGLGGLLILYILVRLLKTSK